MGVYACFPYNAVPMEAKRALDSLELEFQLAACGTPWQEQQMLLPAEPFLDVARL